MKFFLVSIGTFVRKNVTHILLGILMFCIIAVLGSVFYLNGRTLMRTELRERLETLSTTAAMLFSANDLRLLNTDKDIDRPEYADAIRLLNEIRRLNPDIRFAYILRPTKDPATFQFVADADSLHPSERFDLNRDGVINEEDDLAPPGTPYDVSDTPAIMAALVAPATTDQPYTDQWGTYMSGFAPIFGSDGKAVAVIGFDIDIGNFQLLSNRIFSPFVLLLVLSGGLALGCYIAFAAQKTSKDAVKKMDEERTMLLRLSSHQLGSPLAVLRWSLEELKSSPLASTDESIQAYIKTTEEVACRITAIIKQFQEAERVHAGKSESQTQSIGVTTMTNVLREELATKLHQKEQVLAIDALNTENVMLDRALVGGVLHELLSNASDFSPKHSTITLHIADAGSAVQINVIDEGPGIPQQDLENLFQPFARASNASTFKAEGNGLGLYIAQGVVRAMGGKIWIERNDRKGTTVSLRIPKNKS